MSSTSKPARLAAAIIASLSVGELKSMEAEEIKAVAAEHAQHASAETATEKARPQRDADMGAAAVQIDAPKQSFTDQLVRGQVDDREHTAASSAASLTR